MKVILLKANKNSTNEIEEALKEQGIEYSRADNACDCYRSLKDGESGQEIGKMDLMKISGILEKILRDKESLFPTAKSKAIN